VSPTPAGFLEVRCPVCTEAVPDKGFRRVRVPSHGGKRMRVHEDCAETIEAQGTLAVDAEERRTAA
jgi:hypothetical protein